MNGMRSIPLAVLGLLTLSSLAKAQADSVVLRITSPRGVETVFSGVITLRDSRTERRLDNVRTPFVVTLLAQAIDARFSAADGGALSGDILTYRQGAQRGHVTGTVYVGDVKLYFDPKGRFGFGQRLAQALTP